MPDEPVSHPTPRPAPKGSSSAAPEVAREQPPQSPLGTDVKPPAGASIASETSQHSSQSVSDVPRPAGSEPILLTPNASDQGSDLSPVDELVPPQSLDDEETPLHPLASNPQAEAEKNALPADTPVSSVKTDLISLVIPVLNEKDSLRPLHAEISDVAASLHGQCEIIFVDDGSTDGSWSVIQQLATKDKRVHGVRFRRNFGKAAALSAGFAAARGGVVITMDADLQDDPHEIPKFLASLESGLDVVSGWKKVRHDPWHKTLPSRVFNGMVGVVTGVHLHDHNCGMKAYRAEVLQEVHLYGEMHRFVPVLAEGRGFRVGEMVINHRSRKFGRSKYGWQRFIKGFLDLLTVRFLTGFGRRPQHLLGSIGLTSWGVAAFCVMLLVLNTLVRWIWPEAGIGFTGQAILSLITLGSFLFGSQLLVTGLLSELFIARGLVENEHFSVSERTEPIDL